MSIDASIPLGAQAPQQRPFSIGGALSDIAQIQTAQSDMAEARRKSMARMRTQQLAQQHANDPEAFIDALSAEFPMEGAVYREKYYSGLKEQAQEHKAKIDADKITLDTALQLVQGATPETWGVRRGLAVKLGGAIADQLLPQDYNLDALNGVAQTGRSAAAYLDAQSKATTEFFEGKPLKAAAELFADSNTPEQWKATQEYLSQAGRQGREFVAQFGAFSPEAQAKARQVALSVQEEANLSRQAAAETRQGEQFKASEARQAKQFGMSYGLDAARLGLARQAEARQAKAAAATGSEENLDAVGAMVIDNPDLLKDFPAKDRGKILTHIATAGGAFPNKRKEKITQLATSALDTIKQMEAHPGFSSAVGAKGLSSAFGLKGAPAEGSSAADFVRLSEALKSQVTLPNLELMKGLGAMSDREFRVVADASSALDRSMSEAGYRAELARLKATLQGLATKAPAASPPANTATAPAGKKKDSLGIR